MITINSQPNILHSSGNPNWFLMSSTLRFAPHFNIVVDILDESDARYNTVVLPTNPSNLSVLNISNIMDDYSLPSFDPFITGPTTSNCVSEYKLDISESFEGLYINATSSGTASGVIGTVSVLNNIYLSEIETPVLVNSIGFIGIDINAAVGPIYVFDYGTASDGYISWVSLSQDSATYSGVTATSGNSYGYMTLQDYTVYSYGATAATALKWAIHSYIDYIDYDTSNNYDGYVLFDATSQFLTRSPRIVEIQSDEFHTLSLIQSPTFSISGMYITENGATASQFIPIPVSASASVRIDIPAGPANLETLSPNSTQYTITMINAATASISETFTFKIKCINSRTDDVRLCWVNNLGGIDYYTFRFQENKARKVERSNFDRNLTYTADITDRGITTYKLNNWEEYVVVSDLLSDDMVDWLSELTTSKEVYWIRGGRLIPITLTTDTHTYGVGWDSVEMRVGFRVSRTNKK